MRRALPLLLLGFFALTSCRNDIGPGATPVVSDGNGGAGGLRSPAGGPLLVIGDSIMVGAIEHGGLVDALTPDEWEPETITERGRSASWAIDIVENRLTVARTVVLALGSNPGHSSAGFTDDVQRLRNALVERGARRIVWIPPYHTDPERYEEKIRILTEADRTDGRLYVPPWGAVLSASPEYVGSDGLHLTESGYRALAEYIRDALARVG